MSANPRSGWSATTRGADADGMGLVTLDGGELDGDPGRLLVEAKTASLFGDRRVVRVRNAGKSLTVPLSELADDPSGAIVILEAGNLAPRDALRALVEASGAGRALPCYADSDETILKLITDSFAAAGIRAEPDVAATLRDILGNDREITRRELEKLSLYAADNKLLTREDVLILCADNAALVLDEIADAIGTGHADRLDAALEPRPRGRRQPAAIAGVAGVAFCPAPALARRSSTGGTSLRDVLDGARPKPHFSRRVGAGTAAAAVVRRLPGDGADERLLARHRRKPQELRRRPKPSRAAPSWR